MTARVVFAACFCAGLVVGYRLTARISNPAEEE